MVELVEDFEKLKEHASYCRIIAYKIELTGVESPNPESPNALNYRIRVRAGSYAWDKVVDEETKIKIMKWLILADALKIVGAVQDEMFFA